MEESGNISCQHNKTTYLGQPDSLSRASSIGKGEWRVPSDRALSILGLETKVVPACRFARNAADGYIVDPEVVHDTIAIHYTPSQLVRLQREVWT
jgi:hypothetical protein